MLQRNKRIDSQEIFTVATPSGKLADALEALHELQKSKVVAIRSADLSRTHRQRLLQNGFLELVIKGWYV